MIPAVEINTDEGHLLVFGLDHYVFGMHKTWFLKDMVDKAGGAMLAAHPYRRRFRPEFKDAEEYEQMLQRACTNSMLAIVEGAEVNNGRGSEQENAFATEVCRRLNLKGVATSDSHQTTTSRRMQRNSSAALLASMTLSPSSRPEDSALPPQVVRLPSQRCILPTALVPGTQG